MDPLIKKENQKRRQNATRLDLETPGSRPTVPNNPPRTLQGQSGPVLASPQKVGQLQSTSVNHMDIEKKLLI
jgi:hypothetical protein